MSVSSARPDRLEAFVEVCERVDTETVVPRLAAMRVSPALAPLWRAVRAHLDHSAALATSVAEVALAFWEADRGAHRRGELVAVATPALLAAIGDDLYNTDSKAEQRGRRLGLTGIELARYVRGAELATTGREVLEDDDVSGIADWTALLTLYRSDTVAADGFFGLLGPEGAVAMIQRLHRSALFSTWPLPTTPDAAYAGAVAALSTMLGHHTRSPRTDSAAFASRFADALAGTGRDERIGVVTALAATGSLAPAVLDVMLVTVLDHAEGLPIPFDGHRGWNWGNDLDLRDAHAVVLDAIDRSGCASDVLATRESHATRLLDPDRRYSEAAEAALDRVLDRPRLNLLDGDPADDATATRAIRHLVAATRELDGTVHPAGAAALARITISFPADVTDGFGLGYQAAVDFVAAARSDDRPVLLADHGEWSGAIDAALNEYAASQFDIALRSAAGGDIDLRAAQRAGEAEMLSVVSRVHREALDGAATDEHNAAVRMVGGWIVDVVAVPIKNPLTAVAATQVADWVVGQVWPGGHLDGAKEDLAPAVAVTAAVGAARAVGFAIETGALPSASLPPGVRPVQLLASESGVRTLSKLSAQLPPALVEACEQRMKPASAALVGLNVGHR